MIRGVIVDFDFAVLEGAETLFATAGDYFASLGLGSFNRADEARHFIGRDYAAGLKDYFRLTKCKKTAAKSARELAAKFADRITAAVTANATAGFRNFVKVLAESDLSVAILTRADLSVLSVAQALSPVIGQRVRVVEEGSVRYGSLTADSLVRACKAGGFSPRFAAAVVGSGFGVKSALAAGVRSMAVVRPRVAYQDFTGADLTVRTLSAEGARKLLKIMGVGK